MIVYFSHMFKAPPIRLPRLSSNPAPPRELHEFQFLSVLWKSGCKSVASMALPFRSQHLYFIPLDLDII
ncbi:hypothetical protein KOW79_002407 [Hemibagrus wyckioides]|uniref:Uncharacterized protein n=1 Tax=Hemibagrus wyckioides TaxID=337641 RepID=A0A9D3P3F5_9TELE|nr:hypothetical protein KOW79_002407 [Hemibagrus wyckioides]